MQDRQSLAKTSNLLFRDDVSKGEQGLNVGPLFTRMDYFASEDANVSVKRANNATKLGELPKYTSQTVISAFNMRAFPSLLEVFKLLAKGKTWDWVGLNMLG